MLKFNFILWIRISCLSFWFEEPKISKRSAYKCQTLTGHPWNRHRLWSPLWDRQKLAKVRSCRVSYATLHDRSSRTYKDPLRSLQARNDVWQSSSATTIWIRWSTLPKLLTWYVIITRYHRSCSNDLLTVWLLIFLQKFLPIFLKQKNLPNSG